MTSRIITHVLAASAALLLTAAVPTPAADPRCAAESAVAAYGFIAGRSLSPAEERVLRAEEARHPEEAGANACQGRALVAKLAATADPVKRAERRALFHQGVWFSLPAGDPRRALLQRIAPIAYDDPRRKLAVRQAALQAYLASVAFAARQYGMAMPANSVAQETRWGRANFARMTDREARTAVLQEALWESLRRGWAAKPAAWRRQQLQAGGRPADSAELQRRAVRMQLAVAAPPGRDPLVNVRRYSSALRSSMGKMGALAAIYGGARP